VVQAKRASTLPQVPTVSESIPGFALKTWFGLFAPAKTDPKILAKLNHEVAQVLAEPEVREKLSAQGVMIETGSAASLAALVQSDIKRYQELATKIKLEAN
ncbi:MAG: tripartite tricarboxylate transporter substrate binding protein, partial [Burkholderiales bacterium]|nr:tripartite tricarboxylate transporter substrate binding protein [Burkholderiales bacterium]